MTNDTAPATTDRLLGNLLAAGTLGSLATMGLHPTHWSLSMTPAAFAHTQWHNIAVHALALACVPLLALGQVGLARRLGLQRPPVMLALSVMAMALVAVMLAAIADGLVGSALAARAYQGGPAGAERWRWAFDYNYELNQGCAWVYAVATTVAVLCWSWALRRQGLAAAWLAGCGAVCGAAVLGGMLVGVVGADRVGFTVLVGLQALWLMGAAAWLRSTGGIRRGMTSTG